MWWRNGAGGGGHFRAHHARLPRRVLEEGAHAPRARLLREGEPIYRRPRDGIGGGTTEGRELESGGLASQRASGADVERRGLAKPEQDLLQRLVDILTNHRREALGLLTRTELPTVTTKGPVGATPSGATLARSSKGGLLHILAD